MSGRHRRDRHDDQIGTAPGGTAPDDTAPDDTAFESSGFDDTKEKWWFNMTTGAVEYGRLSPSVDRAGPFDTEAEASHAPETIEARARKWRSEDEEGRTR